MGQASPLRDKSGAGQMRDLSSALPITSGQYPTIYQLYDPTSPIDVVGAAFQAVPSSGNGYLLLNLPQCQHAQVSTYGSGCPVLSGVAAYEQFTTSTFDLSNSGLMFIPAGSSYLILPGNNTWFAGFSNNLALLDDSVATVTLPYPFPHVAGTTSTITVSSNGFLWLGTETNSACCNGDPAAFLSDPMARIAALWMDLAPNLSGGVYADFDTATGEYVVTWSGVQEFSQPGNLVSMQIALQPSGTFEVRFQNCNNLGHDALTGYSMGAVPNDPGNSDFSTLPIVTGTIQTIPPVVLAPQAASVPQIGSTFAADISDLPPGAMLAVFSLGFTPISVDLSMLGMPGCFAWVDIFTPGRSAQLFLPVTGPTVPVTLTIPNSSSIVGMRVHTQAAVLAPGVNALGIATSNGMRIDVGL